MTTTRITHATPAVFATHIDDRDNENAIAEQYVDSGVDVLLGGGLRHLSQKGNREANGMTTGIWPKKWKPRDTSS